MDSKFAADLLFLLCNSLVSLFSLCLESSWFVPKPDQLLPWCSGGNWALQPCSPLFGCSARCLYAVSLWGRQSDCWAISCFIMDFRQRDEISVPDACLMFPTVLIFLWSYLPRWDQIGLSRFHFHFLPKCSFFDLEHSLFPHWLFPNARQQLESVWRRMFIVKVDWYSGSAAGLRPNRHTQAQKCWGGWFDWIKVKAKILISELSRWQTAGWRRARLCGSEGRISPCHSLSYTSSAQLQAGETHHQ